MSRVFVSLLLVASLVSGVFFFTPNNSAEYDEEFYDYQPYLQYDFHLHELDMKNFDENNTQEFSGSVYMRREYSNEESETFRKLLVKSYQLSILDQQYRTEVGKLLGDVTNGTADADDVLANIANITTSYDGKAQMLVKDNTTLNDLITLEMITWVRDNFIIESMIDGKARGLMTQRLSNVNDTLSNDDNLDQDLSSGEKLSVIQREMFEEYYNEPEHIVSEGPTLSINGISAQWHDWEFESVGPTSSLLGSFSDKSDKRLWIGQWMHVTFPNSTHNLGNHTMKFEWPNEDFKGKETNFHVSLGYGEVFTSIDVKSNEYQPDVLPSTWFNFDTIDNNTVGTFTANFTQGHQDSEGYNWFEAADYAETLTYEGVNGHLATISSKEEAEIIYSILDGHTYWLGGFQNLSSSDYSEPSGGWEWVSGEKFNHSIWPTCQEDPNNPCGFDEIYYAEPNDSGSEDCLEVWGFDKYLNDARCYYDWHGIVVEYEMNGTNHYEAYTQQWEWDEINQTDIVTFVITTPITDEERNDILKEEGDPDVDNDGIVDKFDEDDDNDGIMDENDMDDDNDGIDDVSDRCPGTPAGESVDVEGCSSSQILKEVSEDGSLPGFNFGIALLSVAIIAIVRKPRH